MTDPLAIRVLICNTGDLTYLISDVAEEMNFQAENGDYETYELWAGLYTEIAYLLDDETGAHDEL